MGESPTISLFRIVIFTQMISTGKPRPGKQADACEDEWLTAKDVGDLTGKRKAKTIMNCVYAGQEGKLIPKSTKLGGKRVWSKAVTLAWIQERKTAPAHAVARKKGKRVGGPRMAANRQDGGNA